MNLSSFQGGAWLQQLQACEHSAVRPATVGGRATKNMYIWHSLQLRPQQNVVSSESSDRLFLTHLVLKPEPHLNIKTVFPGYRIPMLKIRLPQGCLIFNMGILIHGKDSLYIETALRIFWENMVSTLICWCPGSLRRQVTSSHGTVYSQYIAVGGVQAMVPRYKWEHDISGDCHEPKSDSIPLLTSPEHQQARYWLCGTDNTYCCSGVNFAYLVQAKSKIRFKIQIYLLWSFKLYSMLRVKARYPGSRGDF